MGRELSNIIAFIDGASSGNPGHAGAGVLFHDPEGRELEALSVYLGETTNNVAEYRALILALERAVEMGVRRLKVFSDSQLLVRQFNGDYRVKNAGLKPHFERAKELQKAFDSLVIHHLPREENQRADQLARQASSRRATSQRPADGDKKPSALIVPDKLVAGALYLQEVSLLPVWSDVLPEQVKTQTLMAGSIQMGIPLVSSPVAFGEPVSFATAVASRGGIALLRPGRSSQGQMTAVKKIKAHRKGTKSVVKGDSGQANPTYDEHGRIRVGGVIYPDEHLLPRASALAKAGVDLLLLEASLGHGPELLDGIRRIKGEHPQVPLIAGDVSDAMGARRALESGADGIKVGAPFILGLRVPLFTAIRECAQVVEEHGGTLVADVGVSDLMVAASLIARAIGAGAHVAMAILQPAGKGWQPQILAEGLDNLVDDLRMIMSCCGVRSIEDLRRQSKFVRVCNGGHV